MGSILRETFVGPHDLKLVQLLEPADPVMGPLHVVFQSATGEDSTRYIDVMDASSQTVVRGRQVRRPGGGSGATRRDAAQWLLDIAGVKFGVEVSDLDKWI